MKCYAKMMQEKKSPKCRYTIKCIYIYIYGILKIFIIIIILNFCFNDVPCVVSCHYIYKKKMIYCVLSSNSFT